MLRRSRKRTPDQHMPVGEQQPLDDAVLNIVRDLDDNGVQPESDQSIYAMDGQRHLVARREATSTLCIA